MTKKTNLNNKQELFCKYFVQCMDSVKAATMAGYGKEFAKVQVKRLLENKKIKARIKELGDEPDLIEFLDLKRLINKHIRIALADIGNFAKWKGQRLEFYDSTEVETDVVSEVSQGKDGMKIKLKDDKESLKFIMNLIEYGKIKESAQFEDIRNYIINLLNNSVVSNEGIKAKALVLDKLIRLLEVQQEDINNEAQKDNLRAFLDAAKVNTEELKEIKNELEKDVD